MSYHCVGSRNMVASPPLPAPAGSGPPPCPRCGQPMKRKKYFDACYRKKCKTGELPIGWYKLNPNK